jgi:thiol:disulfide interchange protein DsbD
MTRAAALVLALLAWSTVAVAQLNPVRWSLSIAAGSTAVRPGDTGRATVTATMEEGWHLYAVTQEPPPIATRIGLAKNQPFRLVGSVDAPEPESGFDENFGIQVEYYGGVALFGVTFEVDREAVSGRQPIVAEAHFQACNDRMCLPPQTVRPQAVIEVVGGNAPAPRAPPVASRAPVGAIATGVVRLWGRY